MKKKIRLQCAILVSFSLCHKILSSSPGMGLKLEKYWLIRKLTQAPVCYFGLYNRKIPISLPGTNQSRLYLNYKPKMNSKFDSIIQNFQKKKKLVT